MTLESDVKPQPTKELLIAEAVASWVGSAVTLLLALDMVAKRCARNGDLNAPAYATLRDELSMQVSAFVPTRDWRGLAAAMRRVLSERIETFSAASHEDSEMVEWFMAAAPAELEGALSGQGMHFNLVLSAYETPTTITGLEDGPF